MADLIEELVEAGVHYGHQSRKWNPKMKPFLLQKRSGIHIINVEETALRLEEASEFLSNLVLEGGKVLFVGCKRQAQEAVRQAADMMGAAVGWLGLSRLGGGVWVWSDGSVQTIAGWTNGTVTPVNIDGFDCAVMNANRTWDTTQCAWRAAEAVVCELRLDFFDHCPPGWTAVAGNCVAVSSERLSWENARSPCWKAFAGPSHLGLAFPFSRLFFCAQDRTVDPFFVL